MPHIFFRIPYQVVLDIQKLFWIGTKMKKMIFACHALTHGTHLSWFPLVGGWGCVGVGGWGNRESNTIYVQSNWNWLKLTWTSLGKNICILIDMLFFLSTDRIAYQICVQSIVCKIRRKDMIKVTQRSLLSQNSFITVHFEFQNKLLI